MAVETEEVAVEESDDILADVRSAAEAPAEPVAEAAPAVEAEAPVKDERTAEERARDDKGRFAPKKDEPKATVSGIPPKPAPIGAQAGAAAPPPTAPPASVPAPEKPAELQAPRAWRAIGREAWAKVPPEAQREIVRREHETAQVLQAAAEHRHIAESFKAAVAPYERIFAREGVDTLKGIQSLLPAVQALQEGTPQRKAQVLAQIARAYHVDIGELDSALAGQQQAPQQQQLDPQTIIRQAKEEFAREFEEKRQALAVEREAQAVEAFSAKAEFLDDVRDDMADLLEGAARRGVALTIEEAYDRACHMNPEIRRVLQQREVAANVGSQTSTQRAKAASSSVRSSPSGGHFVAPSGGRIEDDIREVMESLQR